MKAEGSKHSLGIVDYSIVETGGAVNNVEGTPENGAWGQTSEGIPVKLAYIVGYPNRTNGLVTGMGTLVVPPILGSSSGNLGILLDHSLFLDHASQISSIRTRNLLFSSDATDSGCGIADTGLSSGSIVGR